MWLTIEGEKKIAVLIQRNGQYQRTPYQLIIWGTVTSQQEAVSGTIADKYGVFKR